MLITILAFVVALGVLITFHEAGHYLVARWCKVRVLRFSIGFGPVIFSRHDRHGTEWAISALPLGGYVKMLEADDADQYPGKASEAFPNKPLWQRFAIVAAGPLANFMLAIALYASINVIGSDEPAAIVDEPPRQSAAHAAGIQGGQTITAINGESIRSWSELRWALMDVLTSDGEVQLDVSTPEGQSFKTVLPVTAYALDPDGPDPLKRHGLQLQRPRPVITELMPEGAAQAAGLQVGDIVVAVGQQQQPDATTLIETIRQHPNQVLSLQVLRGDDVLTLPVQPKAVHENGQQTAGQIGAMLGGDMPMVAVRYGLFTSLWKGSKQTFSTSWFSLKMLGRMVMGQVSPKNLSGPVTIADYAGQTARAGWSAYLNFMALISISLGILNLLPIPMLDGGHLLFYAIEAVRKGKPLSEQAMGFAYRLGLGLLALLMGLAFYNDFARLFSGL